MINWQKLFEEYVSEIGIDFVRYRNLKGKEARSFVRNLKDENDSTASALKVYSNLSNSFELDRSASKKFLETARKTNSLIDLEDAAELKNFFGSFSIKRTHDVLYGLVTPNLIMYASTEEKKQIQLSPYVAKKDKNTGEWFITHTLSHSIFKVRDEEALKKHLKDNGETVQGYCQMMRDLALWVLTTRAKINVIQSNKPKNYNKRLERIKSPNDSYHIVTLNQSEVKRYISEGGTLIPRSTLRWHEVRSHWRDLTGDKKPDPDCIHQWVQLGESKQQRCLLCGGYRTQVKSHEKGDKKMGSIEKHYRVIA